MAVISSKTKDQGRIIIKCREWTDDRWHKREDTEV